MDWPGKSAITRKADIAGLQVGGVRRGKITWKVLIVGSCVGCVKATSQKIHINVYPSSSVKGSSKKFVQLCPDFPSNYQSPTWNGHSILIWQETADSCDYLRGKTETLFKITRQLTTRDYCLSSHNEVLAFEKFCLRHKKTLMTKNRNLRRLHSLKPINLGKQSFPKDKLPPTRR